MVTNKKMLLFNKKGEFSGSKLGGLLLVVLAVLVIAIAIIARLGTTGKQAQGLYDSGDCDNDNAWNIIDRCPCLSTLGLESNDLRGCPLGTTFDEAGSDAQTCQWFL